MVKQTKKMEGNKVDEQKTDGGTEKMRCRNRTQIKGTENKIKEQKTRWRNKNKLKEQKTIWRNKKPDGGTENKIKAQRTRWRNKKQIKGTEKNKGTGNKMEEQKIK